MILTLPPSMILAKLLMDRNVVSDPEVSLTWPIYYTTKPDEPDNLVSVFDTNGETQGRLLGTGEVIEKPGMQILVRAKRIITATEKMAEVVTEIDEEIHNAYVSVSGKKFLVVAVSRRSAVIVLNPPVREDRREVVVNVIATILPIV